MTSRATVRFVTDLFDTGRVVLDDDALANSRDLSAMSQALVEFEQTYRSTLPHVPPALSVDAAEWAGSLLYRACQFLVYREHGEETVIDQLATPCPLSASPAVCYAVDLTFRFVPDLVRLARAAAEDDPLVKPLLRWASDWPLSSVGIMGVEGVDVEPFIDDPCLRAMYVDRIIAQTDHSRLTDECVREAVREAVGAFPTLAPDVHQHSTLRQSTGTT